MTASNLYSQTLTALTTTRTTMLSPEWQAALDAQNSAPLKLQASQQLVQVQQAISSLSNTALADIAQQMSTQEQAIQTATSGLKTALEDLTKVQNVISAVTNILNTVETISPLLV